MARVSSDERFVLDILTIEDGLITQVNTFDAQGCPGFDLPEVLA